MYEARTPTVPRPCAVGLPLTRLAQEPTLDQDEDEVDDTHSRARTSNLDGPAGGNPYASRRVAMTGTKSKGDEVFIGNFKMVDLWLSSEPHIWGALDEGCNSTCHSRAWGDLVEWKLKSFGLGFPWVDSEAKYFIGLGSTTGTLGRRKRKHVQPQPWPVTAPAPSPPPGGGGGEDAELPDYDPADMVEVDSFHDPVADVAAAADDDRAGVTAPPASQPHRRKKRPSQLSQSALWSASRTV